MIRASNDPEEKRYDFIPEKKKRCGKTRVSFLEQIENIISGGKKEGKITFHNCICLSIINPNGRILKIKMKNARFYTPPRNDNRFNKIRKIRMVFLFDILTVIFFFFNPTQYCETLHYLHVTNLFNFIAARTIRSCVKRLHYELN